MTFLTIIGLILKWLLIILLSILAFALILILLVLIMPISYRADVVYGGGKDLDVKVKVTYFWPIVRFLLSFSIVGGLEYCLKVLFFSIISSDKKKDDDASDSEKEIIKPDNSVLDDIEEFLDEELISEAYEEFDELEAAKDSELASDAGATEYISPLKANESDNNSDSIESEKYIEEEQDIKEDNELKPDYEASDYFDDDLDGEHFSIFERIGAFFKGISLFLKGFKKGIIKVRNAIDSFTALIHNIKDGISDTIDKVKRIKSKGEEAYKKGKRVKKLLDATATKNTLSLAKKQIFKIIKHILPRRIRGYVHYGLDDPSTTGEILAVISAFYPVISPHLEIVPDFNDKVLEADVHIKGRIHLIYIVGAALRILISPDTIRTIKRTKRVLG